MKKLFLLLFIIFCGILQSQNWNVFNKGYRYNYKYNYSNLVSNVLFVDTVKQSGADTIYTLNRIGVECTGSCPTITTALSNTVTYVVPNMPQFLQRCIKKYSNGLVQLFDTTKIVIVPTCTLNQTWLFDSIFNKTAVCVNISTLNIFGNADSVKTIIIQNIDTLILSKSFGIILFPDPYAKNKYYRLVGIEKKASYDLTSLYGEKVPNAWDFYNYDVGDAFCLDSWSTSQFSSSCQKTKSIFNNKVVTPSGYIYNVSSGSQNFSVNFYTGSCLLPPWITATLSANASIYSLSSGNLSENLMYPNMIYVKSLDNINVAGIHNIVKFGLDNSGKFYKYFGRPCSSNNIPVLPNLTAISGLTLTNNEFYKVLLSGETNAFTVGEGFGTITRNYFEFEYLQNTCLTSAVKNNVLYFGSICIAIEGIQDKNIEEKNNLIYPNPANKILNIQIIESSKIEIINTLGESVYNVRAEQNEKIDISNFVNGIYFVSVKNDNFSFKQKVVVDR